ncbi:hypothetical protein TraAM80_03307 [Trypanosoma rangeli]|uniref:Uncharacterized protein n=1 Tax=Trypanosoma rangeli TaxID=5698 RepID=A0A3R7MSH5_TRYRA|nr:uncharacterized protein TraAM80_03307 [Trypanosoma rangeli]RNF07395.1 hypothetical protein TraAM80_03307 [Trypanosoma rangeli]|eukprot:RNF07395.1 hypothetical protein TraAM80_03307 [Trypanosoma rangeli]
MQAKVKDESIVELDPATVYFTFSRIRPTFSCGRTIVSTIDQFLRRKLTPYDLPLLCVLTDKEGRRYSLNNRRLYLYKELRERGVLETVPVRIRQLPDTRRMREKYTPEKCALHATLKREGAAASAPKPHKNEGASDDAQARGEKGDNGGDGDEAKCVLRQEDTKPRRKRRGGRATTLEEELLELSV